MDEKLKIMIVEDHPMNMKLATDLLEMEGFEVYQSPDAERALDLLQTLQPQVILMDVALPGMDGLELTRTLKAGEKTKEIKIIALTAFAMKSDRDRVRDAGCDGYITKPINTRTFAGEILELIK
jgi:CheY-like chemotaxis protein